MKVFTLIVLGAALCLYMASCGPDPGQCYLDGYEKGASDVVRKMEESAGRLRSNMRDDLYPKLVFMSIMAVLITLVGAEIAEQVRRDICDSLKWGKEEQLTAAWLAYIVAGAVVGVYSLAVFGLYDSVPVLILLAGTFIAFRQVVAGLGKGDAAQRKTGIGKVKTLFFLCLVVVMVYHLLSGGIANIRVG